MGGISREDLVGWKREGRGFRVDMCEFDEKFLFSSRVLYQLHLV
jgi:hypothetical protein